MTYPDAGSAVFAKLAGASALTTLVGGSAAPRVYEGQAPGGVSRPYVVYYMASGLMPNRSPRDDLDWVFRVESWADSRASAQAVHEQIYAALHEQTLTITGWTNYRTECERVVIPPLETVEGRQYWRRSGDYRIRASEG